MFLCKMDFVSPITGENTLSSKDPLISKEQLTKIQFCNTGNKQNIFMQVDESLQDIFLKENRFKKGFHTVLPNDTLWK